MTLRKLVRNSETYASFVAMKVALIQEYGLRAGAPLFSSFNAAGLLYYHKISVKRVRGDRGLECAKTWVSAG